MKVASSIQKRITDRGPDSLWSYGDFQDFPQQAAAKALSRLGKTGIITRVRKGLYYYPKQTALGPSLPNPSLVISKIMAQSKSAHMFSGGTASFQGLGLTTQIPAQYTLLSNQASRNIRIGNIPAKIQRRSFDHLSGATQHDIYILDVLRNIKHPPDATPLDVLGQLVQHIQGMKPASIKKLLRLAQGEPPRVRAMLGAIAEHLGYGGGNVKRLKKSLNPLTKYSLGITSVLPNSSSWNIV